MGLLGESNALVQFSADGFRLGLNLGFGEPDLEEPNAEVLVFSNTSWVHASLRAGTRSARPEDCFERQRREQSLVGHVAFRMALRAREFGSPVAEVLVLIGWKYLEEL